MMFMMFTLSVGRVAPHWQVTLSDFAATRAPLFRIQLLVDCGELAVNFGRFHSVMSSVCPLCGSPREDVYHFIVVCPQLADVCVFFLCSLPPSVVSNLDCFSISYCPVSYWGFVGYLTLLYSCPSFVFFAPFVSADLSCCHR